MQLLHDVTKGRRDDLVRKGVPPAGSWGRGRVWRLYSGAVTKQLEFPDMYASLREICEQQAQAEKAFAAGDAVVVVQEPRNADFLQPGQAGTVTEVRGGGGCAARCRARIRR